MRLNKHLLKKRRQVKKDILEFAKRNSDIEAICTGGMLSGYLKGKYVFLTGCFQDSEKEDFMILERRIKDFMRIISLDAQVLPYGKDYSRNFRKTIYRANHN